MAEEIEKLIVSIESNVADLVGGIEEGVDDAEDALKKMERTGKKALDETGKSAKGLGQTFQELKGLATAFVASLVANRVVQFFTQIGSAAIQTNAQFETFTTQFQTLLGSAEAADARLQELAIFGQTTPFELPEVVTASRTLQVFGGTALATGDSLRMIGDIAAGVNQPFQDVAFWVGRMYDAIQNGQPFGEAAARLQEMGALSGGTRRQLESMQKAGADGAEIFAVFSEEVGGKFAGNMERLSGTFQGVVSNLVDFRENLIRTGGQAFFEVVRDDAKEFLDLISEEERQEAIFNLAETLGEAAAMAAELASSPLFEQLESLEPGTIDDFSEALGRAAAATNELAGTDLDTDINGLIDAVTILIDLFTGFTNMLNRVKAVTDESNATFIVAKNALALIKETILDLFFPANNLLDLISGLGNGISDLNTIASELTGVDLVGWTEDFAQASETVTQQQERMIEVTQDSVDAWQKQMNAMTDIPEAMEDVAEEIDEELEKVKETLDKLATDFIDAAEERDQKIEELGQDHAERMAEIEAEATEKRVEAAKDRLDALADLEEESGRRLEDLSRDRAKKLEDLDEDTAIKRSDIFERAKEALAKLESDTDSKLAEEREEFQTEERRETEDHLREMRDLRLRFLEDLEGAVASRDARAVVDLQRRFQREQQEHTDDFGIKQQREREDQDQRLQKLRENEQRRGQEILEAQQRDLAKLEETEARKREKIQETFDEEVRKLEETEVRKREKIDQAFMEKVAKIDEQQAIEQAKEQEDFAKKQAILDEALAKRLEATAKNLSDIEDLNAEHAEQLLTVLNETFGAGGNIDVLMADFENRRRKKLVVKLDFENSGRGGDEDEGERRRPRGGVGGGSRRGRPLRSFQHGTGGTLISKPTLIELGEAGPEMLQVTPASQLLGGDSMSMNKTVRVELAVSGSAPPGIRSQDRDSIAQVLVNALREGGITRQ